MRRAREIGGVGAACLALLVVAVGCGEEQDDPGTGGPGGSGSSDGWSVAGSLADLPALVGGPLTITTADLGAVAEANGLETPDDVQDASPEWLATMSGLDDAVAMVVPPTFVRESSPAELAEATGFWWGAADTFASVSVPPEEIGVFTGGDLGEPEASGPLHVATADDGAVAVARAESLLQEWAGGDATTLEGEESVTAVAEALDEAGAISAALVSLAAPAQMVGVGWVGEDGGDARAVVVYGFASADDAAAAADGLEADFAEVDGLEVDGVAASGSAVTVTVRLAPDQVAAPYEMLVVRGDLPLPVT